MSDRLEGLSPQEKAACLIAEKVLGAVATPWDVDGRQGVVDAMLTLPGGARAAFEVTALAAVGARQTDALLGRDDFGWPSPGQWWWTVQVGSPRDLPRLRGAYSRIALLCEAAGVTRPAQLWHGPEEVDPTSCGLSRSPPRICGVTHKSPRSTATRSATPWLCQLAAVAGWTTRWPD